MRSILKIYSHLIVGQKLNVVNGYPSKPIGLYSKQSIIFGSDSNAEDLEGYAGAGFYDSVWKTRES
ncbi:unnamed protein product [Prunus armeniaca]|uniref:Uncharacterized protein n=1 Tax=Prunus armeniaca TaxID=36596 RepID=A0A6J5TYQ4_PRUAR|nr:unnamed protein product [Prunus armeniaca]CAB4297954.1 unnamed protein product [Prunus armeniaca]